MRIVLVVGCVMAINSIASAMDLRQMQLASGLVEIITKSGPCGYEIDVAALEAYYAGEGLATPEVLSFISDGVSLSGFDGEPSAADCTLARTTARSIGVLKQ